MSNQNADMKKRKDDRYLVTVQANGRRRYFYGSTKREAEAKAAEFRDRLRKGYQVDADQTFGFWAQRWLAVKEREVSGKFFAQYKTTVQRLCDRFGGQDLTDIRPYAVQEYVFELADSNPTTGKPASKRLLELVKQTVNQIYGYAIQNRATEFNPADGVRIPKDAPAGSRRALTAEEIGWINALSDDIRLKPAVMVMLYAGLRRGEVIALTWADVDLEDGCLTVNKSAEFPDNVHGRIKLPKTRSGIRTVYFGRTLKEYLAGLPRSDEYVCPAAGGGMMTLSSFTRGWESVLAELNVISRRDKTTRHGAEIARQSRFDPRFKSGLAIDPITPHMLRHTFCTMMYEAGVDILTAKEQMGHATLSTTLQIYTHLSDSHKREEANKLT